MLALVGRGNMNPSAAEVAEQAGVGLRSVFRHFEEMDSLYREMTAVIEAEIMPQVERPFAAEDWRGRLDELMTRRAAVFERIMPFRVAGAARRFQSGYLMRDYRRALAIEHGSFVRILPKAVASNILLLSALQAATSFESWRTLRQDLGLSAKKAEATMRFTVERLISREE